VITKQHKLEEEKIDTAPETISAIKENKTAIVMHFEAGGGGGEVGTIRLQACGTKEIKSFKIFFASFGFLAISKCLTFR
jgi:hypothetical protein